MVLHLIFVRFFSYPNSDWGKNVVIFGLYNRINYLKIMKMNLFIVYELDRWSHDLNKKSKK